MLAEKDQFRKFRFVYGMFRDQGVIENYKIGQDKFLRFIKDSETLYSRHKNTFHNFDHGVTGRSPSPSSQRVLQLPEVHHLHPLLPVSHQRGGLSLRRANARRRPPGPE